LVDPLGTCLFLHVFGYVPKHARTRPPRTSTKNAGASRKRHVPKCSIDICLCYNKLLLIKSVTDNYGTTYVD